MEETEGLKELHNEELHDFTLYQIFLRGGIA
jgi:hypothetical protein